MSKGRISNFHPCDLNYGATFLHHSCLNLPINYIYLVMFQSLPASKVPILFFRDP